MAAEEEGAEFGQDDDEEDSDEEDSDEEGDDEGEDEVFCRHSCQFAHVACQLALLASSRQTLPAVSSALTQDDAEEEEEEDEAEDEDWEDAANWTPEELCRSADGTIVFSDVNLRADTSPTAVLFQQV